MIIYKVNSQFWDDNLKAGTRSLKVYLGDKHIAMLQSNFLKEENRWETRLIPMGFSYGYVDCKALLKLLKDTEVLIPVLEKEELDSYELIKICNEL